MVRSSLVTEAICKVTTILYDLIDKELLARKFVKLKCQVISLFKARFLDMAATFAQILDWSCSADGFITINFNSEYNKLPVIKEILCRAAIVKTLCQINGIQGVEFMVEGEKYMDSDGVESGIR